LQRAWGVEAPEGGKRGEKGEKGEENSSPKIPFELPPYAGHVPLLFFTVSKLLKGEERG
jgi:hypothetical protein